MVSTFCLKKLLNGFREGRKDFGVVIGSVDFLVDVLSLVGGLAALLVAHD